MTLPGRVGSSYPPSVNLALRSYVVLPPLAERHQLHLGLDFMKEVVVGRVPPDVSQDAADDPDVVGGAAEEFHPLRHVSPPPGANDQVVNGCPYRDRQLTFSQWRCAVL